MDELEYIRQKLVELTADVDGFINDSAGSDYLFPDASLDPVSIETPDGYIGAQHIQTVLKPSRCEADFCGLPVVEIRPGEIGSFVKALKAIPANQATGIVVHPGIYWEDSGNWLTNKGTWHVVGLNDDQGRRPVIHGLKSANSAGGPFFPWSQTNKNLIIENLHFCESQNRFGYAGTSAPDGFDQTIVLRDCALLGAKGKQFMGSGGVYKDRKNHWFIDGCEFGFTNDSHILYLDQCDSAWITNSFFHSPGWGHVCKVIALNVYIAGNYFSNAGLLGEHRRTTSWAFGRQAGGGHIGMSPLDMTSCTKGVVKGNMLRLFAHPQSGARMVNQLNRKAFHGDDQFGDWADPASLARSKTTWEMLRHELPDFNAVMEAHASNYGNFAGHPDLLTTFWSDNFFDYIGFDDNKDLEGTAHEGTYPTHPRKPGQSMPAPFFPVSYVIDDLGWFERSCSILANNRANRRVTFAATNDRPGMMIPPMQLDGVPVNPHVRSFDLGGNSVVSGYDDPGESIELPEWFHTGPDMSWPDYSSLYAA